jgi:pilus assembly protein Flp/PilA
MVAVRSEPYHRTMTDRILSAAWYVRNRVRAFLDTEAGASMVEYAIMVALIAIVAVVAVTFFGQQLSDSYSSIADSVQTAGK